MRWRGRGSPPRMTDQRCFVDGRGRPLRRRQRRPVQRVPGEADHRHKAVSVAAKDGPIEASALRERASIRRSESPSLRGDGPIEADSPASSFLLPLSRSPSLRGDGPIEAHDPSGSAAPITRVSVAYEATAPLKRLGEDELLQATVEINPSLRNDAQLEGTHARRAGASSPLLSKDSARLNSSLSVTSTTGGRTLGRQQLRPRSKLAVGDHSRTTVWSPPRMPRSSRSPAWPRRRFPTLSDARSASTRRAASVSGSVRWLLKVCPICEHENGHEHFFAMVLSCEDAPLVRAPSDWGSSFVTSCMPIEAGGYFLLWWSPVR